MEETYRSLLGPESGRTLRAGADLEAAYEAPPQWIRANFVVALDGAVEVDGRSGGLGDDADREVFATLRALADVVLVGAGTARGEGYGPAWMGPARRARRRGRGQPDLPVVAVVTASADLDPDGPLFTSTRDDQPRPPRPLVLTADRADAGRRHALARVAEVVCCGEEQVDLSRARDELHARGLGRICCEGGPGLLRQLLDAGLVDELCCSLPPVLAGPGRATLSPDGPGREPERLELTGLLASGSTLFARYHVQAGSS